MPSTSTLVDSIYTRRVSAGECYPPDLVKSLDIYSRKIVGWEVHEQEGGEEAAALIQRSVIAEHRFRRPLVCNRPFQTAIAPTWII